MFPILCQKGKMWKTYQSTGYANYHFKKYTLLHQNPILLPLPTFINNTGLVIINMSVKYKEYQQLNLPKISEEMLNKWQEINAFEKSVDLRQGQPPFVFYEGPPSANGMPGIHHVISRTLKDLVCRYKTMQGFQVKRKGGWDTHGLPVELGVEKELGITKEDIGKKISVEDYNKKCREVVMRYKDKWDDITRRMGYWVDLNNPYVTFENNRSEERRVGKECA